ncbi:MAG: NADH:ubiquinone reductase (Na(+)-transporting) subunit C [Paludibacteraceae bacterium]
MNTNKNSYTIIYAIVMVAIVALLLALVSGALKEKQTANVELDKKKQILSSLNVELSGQNIESLYNQYIPGAMVINSKGETISEDREKAFSIDIAKELSKPLEQRELPVYIATVEEQTKYILSVRGAGLWGPIWGYVAFNEDKNSIFGTYFAHASETPGLGAEIAGKNFQHKFIGKKIMNADNKFVSVAVVKSGQTDTQRDYIDGISGGTITSKGVETMLMKSIGQYEPFLKQTVTGGTEE